ncbi:MAG: hypothetical protein AB7S36_14735, partial [Planctomycetota bacterium]
LVPLEGLIDVGAEKARLEKEIARVADFVKKLGGKLSNEKYTANAPADVVQKDRDTLAERQDALRRLEESLAALGK